MACLLSAVLLVTFWNRSLVFGLAIDVALLVVVVTHPHWVQQLFAGGS